MSSYVHHINDKEDFEAKLNEAGDKLVVVDFFATWCGPCKMIAPKIDEMSQELKDVVVFLKVDVDDCEEVATVYNISAMPTFILIKRGEKIEVFSGANDQKLREIINEHK